MADAVEFLAIRYYDEVVGRLLYKDGQLTFEGNADAAAKQFMKLLGGKLVSELLQQKDGMPKHCFVDGSRMTIGYRQQGNVPTGSYYTYIEPKENKDD